MKRFTPLLWPVCVFALSLGVTGWLWQHERQTQQRNLRDNFDFGLRQTATRIEERIASYEQMLRGTRGLFEASDEVTAVDFSRYVDALLGGAEFAGLRAIAYAPLQTPGVARVVYAAPSVGMRLNPIGYDPYADPVRRQAMVRAMESGGVAITDRIQLISAHGSDDASGFLMFMPLYQKGEVADTVVARRAHLLGWVFASFRIADLMSSLYGEGTPGLEVRLHDGVDLREETLMYASAQQPPGPQALFEAQEYIGFAGHTWTLSVRTTPQFEQRYSNDSALIISVAGGGLSLLLALLTWQLVTGRERAHTTARSMTRQLRESAQQYKRIVETASEGIWTVDAQARTTFVNPKMQQLLGFGAEELLGRPWIEFMDGPGVERLHRGVAPQQDVRFRRRDGSDLWASVSTSPIQDAAGNYAGALAMVTDVTEKRLSEVNRTQLEAQLRQSQKMEAIGTLAGGIAHDFNNILAAILGNVKLAQQDLRAEHPSSGRLDQISKAAARARSLVQQIVAFSRQQPQERVNQPLQPLLEETMKLLRSTLPALVELEAQFAATPLRVSADATQLQQVLMNLCTNAWHALHGSAGRIVIGADAVLLDATAAKRLGRSSAGPYAHVWVRDSGSGMSEATRLRVFEPFYTTKPVGQGTGLGLAVVHGIVISHGGAITVDSVPGQGSTFDMYFPLVNATIEAPSPQAPASEVPRGRGEHVLLVDDDGVMLLMVEGLLLNLGYRVTCLDDPGRALELLRSHPHGFDVVVTDFNMPELSGLDLAHELSRTQPLLPVVMTSGFVSDSLRADAQAAGVRHVLQKEYTLEQLGVLVHRALTERAEPARGAGTVPAASVEA